MKGYLSGFKQPEAIEAIQQKEVAFRQEVAKHPELQASAGEMSWPWQVKVLGMAPLWLNAVEVSASDMRSSSMGVTVLGWQLRGLGYCVGADFGMRPSPKRRWRC